MALPPAERHQMPIPSPGALVAEYGLQAFEEPSAECAAAFVKASAAILEFSVVDAVMLELFEELGLSGLDEIDPHIEAVIPQVRDRTGLDPDGALNELMLVAPDYWAAISRRIQEAVSPEIPPFDDFVRAIKAMIAACPIEKIERMAIPVGQHEWGHRARMAYEALEAFVRRHDPRYGRFLREAGRLYASGRLALDEAARLLNQHPTDAIALFEEHGHSRRADRDIFAAGERAAKLEKVRAERLGRGGRATPSSEAIFRDTVASCRIESLDARRWLRRE